MADPENASSCRSDESEASASTLEERSGSGCCGERSSETLASAAETEIKAGCCGGSARDVAADAAAQTTVDAERRLESNAAPKAGGCGCGNR